MSINTHIEKANTQHLNGMVKLLNILLSQEADFTANEALQEKGLKLILNDPDKGQLFVALRNNDIIGMVNLLFTISTAMGSKVAILEDMVVLPEFRNQGIGGLLMNFALDYAKNEGYKRVTLLTDNDNEKAHDFYAKHEFEKSNMLPFRKVIKP